MPLPANIDCHWPSVGIASQVRDSVADIDSNSLWVVEGLTVHYGGADCTESTDIRIKHMMTNTYLTFGADGGLASLDSYANDMAGAIDGFECRYAVATASLPLSPLY